MEEDSQLAPLWPLPIRIAVLGVLMLYLAVVVLAPLTNPSGAPYLTEPMAKRAAPIHQALYLNHGYRFFAPDPGPSHSLVYEIETVDGTKIKGHFPDRENTSPRLLYHRWFMLSESMYREFLLLSFKPEIDALMKTYDQEIAELARQGETEKSKERAAQKARDLQEFDAAKVRFDGLMLRLGRNLVTRFGGSDVSSSLETSSPEVSSPKSIRMWIRRRAIPTTGQSLSGVELTDEGLLTQAEVAYFTAEQLAIPDEVAEPTSQPELETVAPAGGGDE